MSNSNYNYRDAAFNTDHAYNYVLLIEAGKEAFSYAVAYNNYLIAFEENCPLKKLGAADEVLNARYKKVVIGIGGGEFFLIPLNAFNPGQVADVARLLDVKSNEVVRSQRLDDHNQVIFKTDEQLTALLTANFPGSSLVMASKGWINVIEKSDPSLKNLYLNLSNDGLEILNFKNSKLRFYNRFHIKGEDDLVYFTSIVASDLQLQAQSLKLVLSGNITAGDGYHRRLSEFFEEIEFNALAPVKLPADVAANKVLSIAALALCAS